MVHEMYCKQSHVHLLLYCMQWINFEQICDFQPCLQIHTNLNMPLKLKDQKGCVSALLLIHLSSTTQPINLIISHYVHKSPVSYPALLSLLYFLVIVVISTENKSQVN